MSLTERKDLLSHYRICFHCLASTSHQAKDCTAVIKCAECQSDKHVAALHIDSPSEQETQTREPEDALQQGREPAKVTANCTELCGNAVGGKSCSKICPAYVYKNGHPKDKVKVYMVIDDQSNCSLAKPKLFDLLKLGGATTLYTLRTCSGTSQVIGRCARNLIIESLHREMADIEQMFHSFLVREDHRLYYDSSGTKTMTRMESLLNIE